jgi:hypothetical protein
MARGRSDQEVLVLGRVSKAIEELDDPMAAARIASYLYLRFTAAGEAVLQSEDRAAIVSATTGHGATMAPALPPPAPATPLAAPAAGTGQRGAAGREPGTPAGATVAPASTPAAAPKAAEEAPKSGWDLSGKGSEHDDDPEPPKPAPKPTKTTAKPAADGNGWDLKEEEVEVKI